MNQRPDQIIVEALASLWGWAMTLAGDRDVAEDLVQETCARALGHRSTLAEHPNPRAWLFLTLRNIRRDRLRAELAGPRVISISNLADGDGEIPVPDPSTLAGPTIARESLDGDVHAALHALPEEFRSLLWLREVEGMSYAEIADSVDVPVGTVRSRLARARLQMAETLVARRGGVGNPKERLSKEVGP